MCFKVAKHLAERTILEVFYEIVDFFVLDMCSKPILCSKIALGCST